MNLAEAAANRELIARVITLESQVRDLTRRLDDISKSLREEPKTLKLSKQA